MTRQKQRKQPILTDDKNIFNYCFQPIQRFQTNFKVDGMKNVMAQQKQRKELISTDDKIIFTYCVQPIKRLQPNFNNDDIRNFKYTKHNRDNARIRILSFIPHRQRIQLYFMYHASKQPNKQTQPE